MINGPFRFRGGFEAPGGCRAPGVGGAGPVDRRLTEDSRDPATNLRVSGVLSVVGRIRRVARESER